MTSPSSSSTWDAIIVGGGMYGCIVAIELRKLGLRRVCILERESEILQRASFVNQARVHNGYHYPRSFLTAQRSRVNFTRFCSDYNDCIRDGFQKYYAISRVFSNVTASQFRVFCEAIGAELEVASPEVTELFNPDLIEAVYRVTECAFDATQLAHKLRYDLRQLEIECCTSTEVHHVAQADSSLCEVHYTCNGNSETATTSQVFNCTYSRLNKLLSDSELQRIPLKHEMTELALVHVPEPFKEMGITVMCGPFFSVMPFPPRGIHSLSHVRYTPHCEWHDANDHSFIDPYEYFRNQPQVSNFSHMIQDAKRYIPALEECRYDSSIWEVKSVLPKSETDDSRPILFRQSPDCPPLVSIMGSKIDNVYDIVESLIATTPIEGANRV